MKVLITRAGGQLGRELERSAPANSCVYALSKEMLDVTNRTQVESCLRELCPQIFINAAAYTAVDQAEKEPDQAYAVNAIAPSSLARVAATAGSRLVHLSTDFVFSGSKSLTCLKNAPHSTFSPTRSELRPGRTD